MADPTLLNEKHLFSWFHLNIITMCILNPIHSMFAVTLGLNCHTACLLLLKCEDLWVLPCGKNESFYVISRSRFSARLCLWYTEWVSIYEVLTEKLVNKCEQTWYKGTKTSPLWNSGSIVCAWALWSHSSTWYRFSCLQTKTCSTQQLIFACLKQRKDETSNTY